MSERIGRYELVKPLAEGDRGKLYLARSTGYGGFARVKDLVLVREAPTDTVFVGVSSLALVVPRRS